MLISHMCQLRLFLVSRYEIDGSYIAVPAGVINAMETRKELAELPRLICELACRQVSLIKAALPGSPQDAPALRALSQVPRLSSVLEGLGMSLWRFRLFLNFLVDGLSARCSPSSSNAGISYGSSSGTERASQVQVIRVVRKQVRGDSIELLVLAECGGHMHIPQLLSSVDGPALCILLPWIADRNPTTYVEAALMMLHLAEAVSYLHAHGFVHRDLKRSNVRFTGSEAFLIDFDLAAMWRKGDAPLTQRVGTRGWYAPEVAADPPSYGSEVDVWGLGLVQLEVLSRVRDDRGPSGACLIASLSTDQWQQAHTTQIGPSATTSMWQCSQHLTCVSPFSTSRCTYLQKSPRNDPHWMQSLRDSLRSTETAKGSAAKQSRSGSAFARQGSL